MGLSVASLFGYRNGSIQISTKAWRKLEQAEERVARNGMRAALRELDKFENRLMEDSMPYKVNERSRRELIQDAFSDIRRGLDRLESILLNENP